MKLNKTKISNIALISQVKLADSILSLQLENVADCEWDDRFDAEMLNIETTVDQLLLSNDDDFKLNNKSILDTIQKILNEYWKLLKQSKKHSNLNEFVDFEEEINYKS